MQCDQASPSLRGRCPAGSLRYRQRLRAAKASFSNTATSSHLPIKDSPAARLHSYMAMAFDREGVVQVNPAHLHIFKLF